MQTLQATNAPTIVNISGYKFIALDELPELRESMLEHLGRTGVLGTLLLAPEGINIALAGCRSAVHQAVDWLKQDPRFADVWLKESESDFTPFTKLKVRIRKEIIAFDGGAFVPDPESAPALPPAVLKDWLDQGRDLVLLDTRNTYEIESGSFHNATTLPITTFKQFCEAVDALDDNLRDKTIVTFCTGGVRCEKAAPWMVANGFSDVYQIEGGILNYFEQCGSEHWDGNCFVFDDRVEITPSLEATGSVLCHGCHCAVSPEDQQSPLYKADTVCPNCVDNPVRGIYPAKP